MLRVQRADGVLVRDDVFVRVGVAPSQARGRDLEEPGGDPRHAVSVFNQVVARRRAALEQTGYFRPGIMEDYDLALRLSLVGPWAFITDPLVVWYEHAGESLSRTVRPTRNNRTRLDDSSGHAQFIPLGLAPARPALASANPRVGTTAFRSPTVRSTRSVGQFLGEMSLWVLARSETPPVGSGTLALMVTQKA